MKLQLKILLPIVVLMMLLLGISSVITYNISSASLKDAIVNNMADEAHNMSRSINNIMLDSIADMVRTAGEETVEDFYSGDVYDARRAQDIEATLKRLEESYHQFDRITLLDSKGVVIASTDVGVRGSNFSNRPYFTNSIIGKTFLTPPYMSSVTKTGVMVASAPVYTEGKVVGVIYGTVTLEDVYDTAIKSVQVGTSGYGYVVDSQGQIVIADPAHKDWLFNPNLASVAEYKKFLTEPDGDKVIAGNDGKPVEIYHVMDKETGLMSIVRAEPDDVFSSLATLRNMGIIIALASILLGTVVVFIIVQPIVKSLNKGVVFAKDIAAGNLQSQLDVKRKDEIGQLADALRAIPVSLNEIITEYGVLEKRVETGELDAQGEASRFSGDFAKLIQGTNGILTRFRTIIDNIPSPVVILNKDLVANYLNIVARQVAGEDYKGKTCFELMAREDFNGPTCALKRAVDTKDKFTSETVAHPQGATMDISYTAIPMLDDKGQIVAVMQLITDLTALKKTQRTIVEVANQAMEISNRVATASEQLSAQVDQVSAGTEVQRERASSTATAMEEMNSTVLEVARNAGQAREQAEATQSKANEGAEMVRQVIAAIGEVNTVAQQLETNMQELGAQAENIGSVMNVISDIADQTNLLALNAAIEAARAGEAGRGFAVVADEVRKLAEKTMGATSEVGASISGIQSSTAKNIERVAEAAKGVGHSTELASTSGEALSEILRLASGNAELITGIAAAAEEQSATSEEINHAIEEINRIAGETASGMNDSAKAVNELSSMAQKLNTLLDKLQSNN